MIVDWPMYYERSNVRIYIVSIRLDIYIVLISNHLSNCKINNVNTSLDNEFTKSLIHLD